jgi:NADPH:quinone reductase-like Zn-dependent oxidoreductase
MRALLLTAYGDPPSVAVGDIVDPVAGAGQILVGVHAAALNPIDAKLARGWMSSVMTFDLPVALGWDFAGAVEAVGPGVEDFAVGQSVFGSLGPPTGSAAELLVADASGPWLAHRPPAFSALDAAAVPMVGLTALTAQRALNRSGTVLVIGASGGIGAFLVPLLARAGIDVLATAAGEAVSRLKEAGAGEVIDFRAVDVAAAARERAPDGVDAVIDLVNQFDALVASAELVRPGGQLLSTLFGPDPSELTGRDVELTYVRNSPLDGDLDRVAELVVSGVVTPVARETVAFADAASGFARLADGTASGKIVLDLSSAGG